MIKVKKVPSSPNHSVPLSLYFKHIQCCVVCSFESGENQEDLGKGEWVLLFFSVTHLLLPLTYHVLRVVINSLAESVRLY